MNWSLENAERVLTPEVTYEDANEIHEILFEPYGVAACISPWNFPASNFVWACFQALCTGNTVVFKNSEEVQLFGQEIEKMAKESGFPEGVFNVIYGDGAAAQAMIADDINIISFTGSTRVGEILYKQAAEKFIPLVLELGGSDPGLIFADADMNKVIPSIYAGRFTNCGQVCQSMKRVIVHESRFDEVVTKLSSLLSTKKCGDPMKMDTDIGPLVSQKQLDTLVGQVQDAIDKGAKIICGGKRPDGLNGAYFEPTILTNITPDMRIWREEVFGPVLPIVSFKDEDEGFAKANDTIYGLSSNVFSEDKDLISRAISKLQAGTVRVNGVNAGRPCNIFGGYKKSGLGRENGAYGLHDMTQKKMVSRNK
jgi:acyl-CoA reductase-like NAD-dependent aldehyde dehydrogenase